MVNQASPIGLSSSRAAPVKNDLSTLSSAVPIYRQLNSHTVIIVDYIQFSYYYFYSSFYSFSFLCLCCSFMIRFDIDIMIYYVLLWCCIYVAYLRTHNMFVYMFIWYSLYSELITNKNVPPNHLDPPAATHANHVYHHNAALKAYFTTRSSKCYSNLKPSIPFPYNLSLLCMGF